MLDLFDFWVVWGVAVERKSKMHFIFNTILQRTS